MTAFPFLLASLLIAASFLSGLEFPFLGLNVRPEQLAGGAALVALLGTRRPLRLPRAALPVVVWVVIGAVGAADAPDPGRAILHALRLLVTTAPVVVLPALLEERRDSARAWDAWLASAVAAGTIGLAGLGAHAAFGTRIAVTVEPVLGFVHAKGPLIEPNVFGALAAAGAVALSIRLFRRDLGIRDRLLTALGAAILLAALLASVTRAAWLAFPIALAVSTVVLALRSADPRSVRRLFLAGAGAAAILLVVVVGDLLDADSVPEARTGIAGRIAALTRLEEDPNVAVRLKTYRAALAIWSEHPFLGAGHGAMERIAARDDFELAWAGNLEIHLLADTGLLGLAALAGFALVIVLRTVQSALRDRDGDTGSLERLGALVVLLVTAQATETSWLASFWVLFGLAVAGNAGAQPVRARRPRRILFVHPSDELYGSDRVLLELVLHLDRDRFEPIVLLSTDVAYRGLLGDRLAAAGVRVVRFPIGVLRRRAFSSPALFLRFATQFASSFVRICRLIQAEEIDVVHANTVTVLPGALAAIWCGTGLVWHIHEVVPDRPGRSILSWLVVRAADHAVTVSEAARASLRPGGGSRVLVIPNGTADRGPVPPPFDPPVVSFIGRLSERKGPHVFLAAARQLTASHPTARFVLAGDEPYGSDRLRTRLHAEIVEAGLADRVEFRSFLEATFALYAEASIVVSPSLLPESFGLVVLEAMAAGRPVVATRVGGPAELIVDGTTGLLVPPGDVESLATAIGALLDDTDRSRRMGEAGRLRALQLFSVERMAERFGALYARPV